MRRSDPRDRAAGVFFGLLAVLSLAAAVASSSVVLGLISIVFALAAAVSVLRHFPVDRTW